MSKARLLIATLLALGSLGAQANVILLTDPSQMTTSFIDSFETGMNGGPFTFSNAIVVSASALAGGVTASGTQGLGSPRTMGAIATLSSSYTEVGLVFGADPAATPASFRLSAYSGATLLGSVVMASNMNTFADQFIGLSSTVPFDRVMFRYVTPSLDTYVDDVRVGSPVPEPAAYALLAAGLAVLGLAVKRREA